MIRESEVRAQAAHCEDLRREAEIDRVANSGLPARRPHPVWSGFARAVHIQVLRAWAWLIVALAVFILLLSMLVSIVSSPDFVFGVP